MRKRLNPAAALVVVILSCCAAVSAQTKPAAATQKSEGPAPPLREQARRMSRSFIEGDYEALLDATYPRILELAGGRANMLAVIRAEAEKWRAQNVKVLAYEPGEPGEAKKAGSKLVSVVPAELKMEFGERVVTQKSFMLAVSTDGGKVWKFISGSHLNKDTLRMLVPEAVGVVTLPAAEEPVIQTKQQ